MRVIHPEVPVHPSTGKLSQDSMRVILVILQRTS